jgi:excisionase family DNA binding protein
MEIPIVEDRPTLTVEEGRALLGIGRSAMYDAIERGDVPSIRIGRRIVIPTAALRRMLQLDEPVTAQ